MHNSENIKRGVAVWMFNPSGQVLMGQRLSNHGNGTWAVPGGKPEKNEFLVDAAVREIWEETGIALSPRMLTFICETDDVFPGVHYLTAHYRVDGIKALPSVIEKDKCAGWRWFDMKKLPTPLFLPAQNLLNQKVFGV